MRLTKNDQTFVYRVAGIALKDGQVLIHRSEFDAFWAMPGGGCEIGEDSKSALIRELKEEIEAEVEVGRLLWIVENFFEHEGRRHHELGFYYEIKFVGSSAALYDQKEFEGVEVLYRQNQTFKLHYKWVPLGGLQQIDLRPSFLKNALAHLPLHTQLVVHKSKGE